MSGATTQEEVRDALATVVDPCSQAAGIPLSLPDMGLVAAISITDGGRRVEVTLRVTAPQCLFAPLFAVEAENRILDLPTVDVAVVTIADDLDWSEDDLSPRAKAQLAAVRSHGRNAMPVALISSPAHR